MEVLIKCIDDYLRKIEYSNRLLAIEFNNDKNKIYSVISLRKEGYIPSRGTIGNMNYFFHGNGCQIEFPDCIVDFDYGPCGIVGSIDIYKFRDFIESVKYTDKYTTLSDLEILRKELRKLVASNFLLDDISGNNQNVFYKRISGTDPQD